MKYHVMRQNVAGGPDYIRTISTHSSLQSAFRAANIEESQESARLGRGGYSHAFTVCVDGDPEKLCDPCRDYDEQDAEIRSGEFNFNWAK